jgi:hypothetical protein
VKVTQFLLWLLILSAVKINNQSKNGVSSHITVPRSEKSQIFSNIRVRIPYDQLLIQTFHHNGKLNPEQCSGEPNPLLQLAIDTDPTSRPSLNRATTPPTAASQTSSNSTMVM